MAMPKTAVNKDDRPVAREHDVWRAGQVLAMQAEAEPEAMSDTPNDELRARCHAPERVT